MLWSRAGDICLSMDKPCELSAGDQQEIEGLFCSSPWISIRILIVTKQGSEEKHDHGGQTWADISIIKGSTPSQGLAFA
jgi:hypothetical protein